MAYIIHPKRSTIHTINVQVHNIAKKIINKCTYIQKFMLNVTIYLFNSQLTNSFLTSYLMSKI